jgi:predicted dehydrogenase
MKVAVIGCGFQGKLHAECLTALPGVKVIAVADPDASRRTVVASANNVPRQYDDYRHMLDAESYDLVTVCTMAV